MALLTKQHNFKNRPSKTASLYHCGVAQAVLGRSNFSMTKARYANGSQRIYYQLRGALKVRRLYEGAPEGSPSELRAARALHRAAFLPAARKAGPDGFIYGLEEAPLRSNRLCSLAGRGRRFRKIRRHDFEGASRAIAYRRTRD